MRALERLGDLLTFFHRGTTTGIRLGTGTETTLAELHLAVSHRALERLRIGIRRNEIDAHDTFANHVIDSIAAGAADADDFDHRPRVTDDIFLVDDFKHGSLLSKKPLQMG